MSKTLGTKTNFRVVIEPRRLGDMGFVRTSDDFLYGRGKDAAARIAKEYEDRCNNIVADVKRHADNVGAAYVEFDQPPICEHCGADWTEESSTYNGGCCSKDEEAEMARQEEAVKAGGAA